MEMTIKWLRKRSKHQEPNDCAGKSRPLRVLIVAPSLDLTGGQAVQAARLVEHLSDEPSLSVSFLPINPRWPSFLHKLQRIKYLRTIMTSLLYCATLLVRVRSCDIVHVFSASYLSFVLAPTPAIIIAKLYRKKVVLNYRSGEAEDHLQRWNRTAIPTIQLADVVAVPSGYLVDVFARFGLRARSIFNFVEVTRFPFRERRQLRPIFLSNRNLEALYNVGCILRAFAIIQRWYSDAQLIIAGDGTQRLQLESLSRELRLRNVRFIGYVAPEKMPEHYDAADIYLNGSDIDNMPGSIIEAYCSGLPVVTTNAGGIPYILSDGNTGLMVQCGDYEGMAASAISLLEDDSRAAKIIRQAHQECQKYAWASVREEWLSLYHEIAHGNTTALRTSRSDSRASPTPRTA